MTVSNQIVLLTGASSDIGKSIALALAAQGMAIRLTGRNTEKVEAVAALLRNSSPDVRCYTADLERDDDIANLVNRLNQDDKHINILIHCAGYPTQGPLESTSVTELDRSYRVCVRAPYLLTQLLLPMLRKCHGQIVFMNSSIGVKVRANMSQYAAARHGMRALADCLRQEVNSQGISVMSIYPGRTATEKQALIHASEGKKYKPELLMQPKDVADMIVHALSLPRSAEVTDIHLRPMVST